MLEVNNLTIYSSKNSAKKYLLDNINFSLKDGESLGIIGKSGSGKSTLAKALLNIYDDNFIFKSGNVFINGEPFIDDFRGKKIALLFQNPNSYLNPLMKVGKQIEEMFIFHMHLKRKEAREKTLRLMELVKIDNYKKVYDYYPDEISGGMKQRICLCIAISCHPDILVLDEFTSYVNEEIKKHLFYVLNNLKHEYKFSLIMISHDFKDIYNMCDKIAIIDNGKLIEIGNKDDVICSSNDITSSLLNDYLLFSNFNSNKEKKLSKEDIYELFNN